MFLSLLKFCHSYQKYIPDLYEMHRRLSMGFPKISKKQSDPGFVERYLPDDFQFTSKVGVQRSEQNNFLFRVNGSIAIVRSGVQPNWDFCFQNVRHLLEEKPVIRQPEDCFEEGEQLGFSLMANPSKKQNNGGKGFRVGLYNDDDIRQWLIAKGECGGFEPLQMELENDIVVLQKPPGKKITYCRTLYAGSLVVTNQTSFCDSLVKGIGPAKGLGFGLLLVKRV